MRYGLPDGRCNQSAIFRNLFMKKLTRARVVPIRLCERRLTDPCRDRLRLTFLAEICQEKSIAPAAFRLS